MHQKEVQRLVVFKKGAKGRRINKIMSKEKVHICSFQWTKQRITEDALLVQKWNCTIIDAYGNECSEILKDIQHIAFDRLESLNVWGNNIISIEGLCRINMPNLASLWIWNNQITSMLELRKAHWPNLKIIDAKNNMASELSIIAQISMKKCVRLHVNSSSSFTWLAKMPIDDDSGLDFYQTNQNQIEVGRFRSVLKRKFEEKFERKQA